MASQPVFHLQIRTERLQKQRPIRKELHFLSPAPDNFIRGRLRIQMMRINISLIRMHVGNESRVALGGAVHAIRVAGEHGIDFDELDGRDYGTDSQFQNTAI